MYLPAKLFSYYWFHRCLFQLVDFAVMVMLDCYLPLYQMLPHVAGVHDQLNTQ